MVDLFWTVVSPTGEGTDWLNFKHWLPFSLCLLVCTS